MIIVNHPSDYNYFAVSTRVLTD